MCDFSTAVNDVINTFSGNLIVGHHDSITLFGIHAQNSLKDYSRRVTSLLLKDTEDLEMAMADVLAEIEKFENRATNPTQTFWGKQRHQRELVKEYSKILSYIDNMTLYFKLQQTQLIKEIKLLDKLSEVIISSSQELEQCIEVGKTILQREKLNSKNNDSLSPFTNAQSEEHLWYERLKKRIEDLAISHTLALQSQAQIKVLHDNDLMMLDRISSAVSNTFPIWQNQMALTLGVELLETRLDAQEKILDASEKHINQSFEKVRKRKSKRQAWNIDSILRVNQTLKKALDEMTQLEETDDELRKEFLSTIYHGEGEKTYE